jgi:hypothetical protein
LVGQDSDAHPNILVGTSADCSRAKVTLGSSGIQFHPLICATPNLRFDFSCVAESIPTDISIEPVEQITYDSWMRIIGRARQSIDIACFYMSLTDGSQYPPEDGSRATEHQLYACI